MATTEQFSLRWNNFHSNLTTSFHELLEAAEMVDVTLAVDGHFLQAHKIVLSICSPYFKQMFKVNPCKHPIVILKDVCHENMKDILEFMYMGEVNVLRENLSSFLRTAELLQVKGLTGDDSQSDASSKKDEKLDNICDNEDDPDLMQFNQLMDSDVEIPSHYSTPLHVPTPSQTKPVTSANTKRQSKSASVGTNSKRPKPDTSVSHNNKANKQVNSSSTTEQENGNGNSVPMKFEEGDFIDAADLKPENLKSERMSMEFDDYKDGIKSADTSKDVGVANSSSADMSGDSGKSETKYTRHTYQCSSCSKKFSRRDHLRTHEKNIHGEDAGPFTCVFCSQMYKNTESLRKHIAKFHFPKINEVIQKAEVQV